MFLVGVKIEKNINISIEIRHINIYKKRGVPRNEIHLEDIIYRID